MKEKWYQFIRNNRTKCPCILCKAKMRGIDLFIHINLFYNRIRSTKWINVQYWGSDYADFRNYEVIGKQKVRIPDGKGLQWPKTKYKHTKIVDESLAGAA
jgi:hypothetical protein